MVGDLHLHTHFSDGTFTPEELAQRAKREGLSVIALTDHDTMEGCPRMAVACRGHGLEFAPGTELTTDHQGREVHMLAYFIDATNAAFQQTLETFQEARQNRILEIVKKLNECNVSITADEIFSLANCRSPGRPHVARVLVKNGCCSSHQEAFERFLKRDRPAWAPKYRIGTLEGIKLIHRAGGLAVLAHPGLLHHDEFIPQLVSEGIDGLECFHSRHTAAETQRYLNLAKSLNLLVTGGSDCHGFNKDQPLIGTVKLPGQYLEALFKRSNKSALLN